MTLLLGWPESHDFDTPVGFAPARPRVRTDKPLQDPNAEGHWLCIAPTGTGKSASFAIPQLLSYPGSVVAVDIKGTSKMRSAVLHLLDCESSASA